MIKRVVIAVFVLALAVTAGSIAGCGGDVPSDAVAKVGDVLIKQDVFDTRVEEFAAQYGVADESTDPEGWKEFELDVLDYLITYEMAAQKAEEYDVAVTDEEVQTEIDSIITSYYDGDEAAFTEDLSASGMTLDGLKSNYRESMLLQKSYEKVTADITEVPDEEIAAYYEENKDSYYVDETRTARHILIAPGTEETNDTTTTTAADASTSTTELTDADWNEALATAEEVRALLVAGGDWTELAAEYSDDTGTAETGGDLGAVSKGDMVKEFEDSVFSLKVDEISEPVKSSYGYHIIQVTDITEAYQQTLEDVSEKISSKLLEQKQKEAWAQWIEDTKVELNVTYGEDMQTTTTTTEAESTTTTVVGDTTTTSAGQSITTAAPTTTTAKP